MSALRILPLAAAIAAAVLPVSVAPAAPPAQQQDPAAMEHEVLVMLRLPPDHYRPGTSYGGAYGNDAGKAARMRIARHIAEAHGLGLVDEWPMPLLGVDCFIMKIPDGAAAEAVAEQLSRDGDVAWAEPMHVYHAQAAGPRYNDPLLPAEPVVRKWRLQDLHQIATGRGVTVAVIDSRIDERHPDLAGQVSTEQDFVAGRGGGAEQHGTGVAGIIAARGGNSLGIVGVAPRARLMGLRACWQASPGSAATVCDSLSLAKALSYAVDHGAQVINLSLSGPPDSLLRKLIDAAMARGATVVAAVDRALPGGGFPASVQGVIAVSDIALPGSARAVYTAPGRDVPTTEPGGKWNLVNGSSYAAAHVSGLVALLRERSGHATRGVALVSSGVGGTIDACASLLRTAPHCDCACASRGEGAAALR